MNLLEGYESIISGEMLNLFHTFRRTSLLTFYKRSEQTISILDPNFNADLQELNSNTTLVEESRPFQCRVWFPRREATFETSIPNTPAVLKTQQDFAEVVIQMEQDAADYISDVTRFSFQGENYQQLGSLRKIGVLGNFQFYNLYLKKVN